MDVCSQQFHLLRPMSSYARVTQIQLISGPNLSLPTVNTTTVKVRTGLAFKSSEITSLSVDAMPIGAVQTVRRERNRQSSADGRIVNGTKGKAGCFAILGVLLCG